MKKILIVYAHPEPKSFCGAIKDTCAETLRANGCEVKVSDLYEMKFIAPLDKGDFTELHDPTFFKPQAEQKIANDKAFATFSPEVKAEHEKVKWCDCILMVFPLYWFHVPGILKNWVDRIFTSGFAYSGKSLAGKKGMVLYTTGAPKDYLKGVEPCFLKLFYEGFFSFTGMGTLEPFGAYSAAHVSNDVRVKYLEELKVAMKDLDKRAAYKSTI